MAGWQSYDAVADCYARLWAPRFERAAAHLLALAAPPSGGRLLDVGTGTGAVPAALGERVDDLGEVVGCDLSSPMLSRARRQVPRLQVAVAAATRLPFPAASFDVVTASFVLSHIPDYPRAIGEALRVLEPGGVFVASDWAPAPNDGCETTWRDLLAEAVGEEAVRRAFQEVVPSDFSDVERLRRALVEGGFTEVRVRAVELAFCEAVTDFTASCGLNAAGRFGRHALGADGTLSLPRRSSSSAPASENTSATRARSCSSRESSLRGPRGGHEMDATSIGRYLFLGAGLPFLFLGSVHAVLTLRDARRPTAFSPTDLNLRDAMAESGLLLTRRLNMWSAWIGFNLSHSLGAVLFGVVLLLVGRSEEEFIRQAGLFLPLGLVVSATYLVLAVKYWYRAPALGIGLSLTCLLLSAVARIAGL